MQIILKKFALTVVRLPLTLLLKTSTDDEFLISMGIKLQTFDSQCLNEFKPISVVVTLFLRKSVCDLKL